MESTEKDVMLANSNLRLRRDIRNLLFHFTKMNPENSRSAFDVLKEILTGGKLLGYLI